MMIPGPDRNICRCFLILVSYSADYPEACMICQIKQGLCVRCNISKDSLYDLTTTRSLRRSNVVNEQHCSLLNTNELSSDIEENDLYHNDNTYKNDVGNILNSELDIKQEGNVDNNINSYKDYVFHNILSIFWNWNLTDIHHCMTPDKLHKIEKDVFCYLLR